MGKYPLVNIQKSWKSQFFVVKTMDFQVNPKTKPGPNPNQAPLNRNNPKPKTPQKIPKNLNFTTSAVSPVLLLCA